MLLILRFLTILAALLVLRITLLIFRIVLLILLLLLIFRFLAILAALLVLRIALLILRIVLLILLLLLFLLFFLLFQLLDLALHQIAIVLRLLVSRFNLQRGVVGPHGLIPGLDRLFRVALLSLLSEAELRVAEIEISALLNWHFLGMEAVLKSCCCPRQVTGFVSRRPGVKLQFSLRRLLRGRRGVRLQRLGKISPLIGLLGCLR